jgi:hypothetical protein
MIIPRSSTETIIGALRVLSQDIVTDDNVVSMCLREAADRMEVMQRQLKRGGPQPIRTATENTRVIVLGGMLKPENCGPFKNEGVIGYLRDGVWHSTEDDGMWHVFIIDPTHWMPLPQASTP